MLVQKKDCTTHFCIDYRKVNAVTRKDAMDDTLDTLSGARWFSTLDLISEYWQVEMSSADQQKTAFCTYEELFVFQVMPFVLCNSPATFQRLTNMVLAGLQWKNCLVYLDNREDLCRTPAQPQINFSETEGGRTEIKTQKMQFLLTKS